MLKVLRPLIKPSDAESWSRRRRQVWLDNSGTVAVEPLRDAFVQFLRGRGLAYERAVLSTAAEPDVRYSHSRCSQCPYYAHCLPGFEAAEDPSLLYDLDRRVVEAFTEYFSLIVWDMRGHRPSAFPADAAWYSAAHTVADTAGQLDRLG